MILIDEPKSYTGRPGIMRGHSFTSSHMISDQEGPAGSRELAAMAGKLGLKLAWLQKAGTHREHYDVMNGMYDKALALGAKPVHSLRIVDVMVGKTWTSDDYVQRLMEALQLAGFYDEEVEACLRETKRNVLREIWRHRDTIIAKVKEGLKC